MPTEPITEAGRAFVEWWLEGRTHPPTIAFKQQFVDHVLAIEAEARGPLTDALRDANAIVASTRQHLSQDHPECAWTALGVMNDDSREALTRGEAEARQGTLDAAAEAFDCLAGMWSWNDAYLDNEANAHLWVNRAGRILRQIVGRPSRQPDALSTALEAMKDG